MPKTTTLAVFAKQPIAGAVKTRLAQATSPAWAARVADAFLHDTLTRLQDAADQHLIIFAPDDAHDYFHSTFGPSWECHPQGPGDLGQRLRRFTRQHFASNAGPLVLVGTDSPSLPVETVRDAFEMLGEADVVLGPATDGGYYLIGLSRPVLEVFDNIEWSTSRVLEQTVARLSDASLRLLPPWYDVDSLDDWHMLVGHAQASRRAGQHLFMPHTESLMQLCDFS